MKKNVLVAIGAILIILGCISMMYSMGLFGFSAQRIAAVLPSGNLAGQVGVFKSFSPFSTVIPGASYQWQVVVKNTGNVNWDNLAVNVILEQSGTRVDITQWGFQWREDTTWKSGDCTGGSASSCSFPTTVTQLAAGSSKTYYIRLTIPGTAYGSYTLKVILNAAVGSTVYSNIASKTDTLTTGTLSGELVLSFIGALSIFGGVASVILGSRKF